MHNKNQEKIALPLFRRSCYVESASTAATAVASNVTGVRCRCTAPLRRTGRCRGSRHHE